MGSTKTASKSNDSFVSIIGLTFSHFCMDKRNHLIGEIAEPVFVATDTPAWIAVCVGPGLCINGIHRENGDFSGIDPWCPDIRHVEVFKVEKTSVLTGDKQDRLSAMTVQFAFHIPTECGTVIFKILYVHVEKYSFQ